LAWRARKEGREASGSARAWARGRREAETLNKHRREWRKREGADDEFVRASGPWPEG
jgi:hypothetical protein